MARLTDEERAMLRRLGEADTHAPPLAPAERFVAPTPDARARYLRFATAASRFHRGTQPVRFGGRHWKL